jgi:hypothetical protein
MLANYIRRKHPGKSPDCQIKGWKMEPCEYQRNIQPITNPETGQQEFQDRQHPLAGKDGMVMLSRHLMSARLGRWLYPGEVVIYRDGNPQNLVSENLELTTLSKLAHRIWGNSAILYCPYCGLSFKVPPSQKNWRVYHNDTCRRLASRKFEIDLEELRQLVWEIPTTQIACLYGVSDKAIEKRCRELGISQPARGYWTRPKRERVPQEEQA